MKKIFFLLTAILISGAIMAQGNSGNKGGQGKGKEKQNNAANAGQQGNSNKEKDNEKAGKEKNEKADHDTRVWEGTSDNSGGGPKASKNQPAKVRAAFQRDYPNATNVYWTKYRGDWTATFGNGIWRSTAVYHANGERRDTRTPVPRAEIPKRVLDEVIKKQPDTKVEEAVKIEMPNSVKRIYRIKQILDGKQNFEYYDESGLKVQYDY
jgi:hypothetical protein